MSSIWKPVPVVFQEFLSSDLTFWKPFKRMKMVEMSLDPSGIMQHWHNQCVKQILVCCQTFQNKQFHRRPWSFLFKVFPACHPAAPQQNHGSSASLGKILTSLTASRQKSQGTLSPTWHSISTKLSVQLPHNWSSWVRSLWEARYASCRFQGTVDLFGKPLWEALFQEGNFTNILLSFKRFV